ncbi:MAG: NAD-dependent 4,6-dehydratase LegB [Rickettsiales bacterium]|jgi:dTDP-glucose 4,6-dehydratase|nr:NAD-dependent 4,6-dehydratase LegB [Rickettsiales bacterium]
MTAFNSILITGAEGFIGSHLAETLVRQGRRVRAMALYNSFGRYGWLDTISPQVRSQIELVMGDVRDPFSVREAMKGCDAVMHLAALIAIPYSYSAPASYVETNVMGTLNVMQAARELGLQKVVHTSTSEVYGTAQIVPIPETHPLVGQSPYSASKIGADQIAYSYFASFGVPVATVRPFNTYGPRQSLRAVIPTIILQALQDKGELALGSLSPTRDFNYVDDTVSGMISILDHPASVGEVINIGSGGEISIGETVKLIEKLTGKTLAVKTEAERLRPENSEVERLCCDYSKAKKLLGWQPRVSLEDGLKRSINWFADPANRAHYHDVTRYTV